MNKPVDHQHINLTVLAYPEAVRLHLESAARDIRAASRSMDAASRLSPMAARALDGIRGAEFIEPALAAQIEALINV